MTDQPQSTRLLDLAGYLAQRGGLTTGRQIADEFATSIRTVYRDIEALRSMGLEIAGEAGSGYVVTQGAFVDWFLAKTLRNPRAGRAQPNYAERRIAAAMMERGVA